MLVCVASTRTLEPLGSLPQLLELSVEHNPLCSMTPAVYRPELLVRPAALIVFCSIHRLTAFTNAQALLTTTLTKLDSQEVTQNERVAAQEAHAVRVSAEAAEKNSTNRQAIGGELQGMASRLNAQ